MITAFVVLCLASDPDMCETHSVPFEGTEMQCMNVSQAIIASFWREGWTVKRFGCRRD